MSTKKLSLALIALLALTPLLIAIPATPVLAAVKEPTVSIDYPYMVIGNYTLVPVRTITVENPLGNPDIKEIRVYVPAGAADYINVSAISGFIPGTSFTVVGAGPWTILSGLPDGFDFILPDGASGKLTIKIDPENAEATEGVVDKYELTVTIKFTDGTTVTKKLYIYEGMAKEVTVGLDKTSIKAGESVKITVSLDGGYVADKGLPLVIWAKNPDGDKVKVAEVATDASGVASATYAPTKAGNWTFYADAVIDAPVNIGAQLTLVAATLTVKPGAPTKVVVKTEFDEEGYTVSYLTKESFNITVSVADKYDNPVTMDVAANVTLSATKGTLANTTTTIPKDANKSLPVKYKPDPLYGTYAMISAKVVVPSTSIYAGTYSGTSKSLRTSTFATGVTITVTSPYDNLTTLEVEVEAGRYATITMELNVHQEGVPVKFEITAEDYAGRLSVVSTTTDEDGKATTRLYVDTEAGKKTRVKAIVSKPITTDPTATFEVKSDEIETIAGAIYSLGIDAPEAVAPEATATLKVYLADRYGNEATTNAFEAAIRVTLSATGGVLEEEIVDIGPTDTNVTVEWAAPAVLGEYVITASTTQYGLASASATILVTTLEPIVNITQPAKDTTISTTENVTTVYIAGWAKPSPAAAAGTVISLFKYSLDKGANVSVPIVSIEDSKAFFNFSLTLEVNKTYTVTVYAIDSEGYEAKASRRITVIYAPPAPVMPTTITAAKTDKPSYKSGEEARISGTVTNNATVSKDVIIRITFIDPAGVPQYPIYELRVTLAAGQSITPTAMYLAGAVKGTWTAKIMVIDAVTGEAIAEPKTLTITVV
ncbi:hypothetical protein KEJ25_02120 [Candidatus Bathyarchaeota archaeon]|nr:hypothetical protein [Candidatus Bathyarchaeota archaeon]